MVRRSCWNGLHNMPFARDNPLSLPIHAGFQLLNPAYSYPWKCRCPIRRLIVEGGSHAAPLISSCKQPVFFGCSHVASCPSALCENLLSLSIQDGFQLHNPAFYIPLCRSDSRPSRSRVPENPTFRACVPIKQNPL